VVKAVALGAKAVMIGRAYLWGMAANGETGVINVLQILRAGIDEALLGMSKSSVHELSRSDLIIPPDFTRTLA
jgi:isopentenyl diphosphate isomerase/L-lactate dehydrogenase-like FMN-dependent dehydrogenase